MLTYTLPAYIVYTTTFCLITQEVLCPPLTHAAKYIQNNIYFFNQVSTFAVGLFCWLFTHLPVSICRILYVIVTIESCKSLPEDVRKSQQSRCLMKMLTRKHKKSQQSRCLTKMLTRRHKKSQQSRYLTKMLTRRHKKSQQSRYLTKMLTHRYKKSQQSSCFTKMLTLLQ